MASIEAWPGEAVWGVLYDMTEEDWSCLHPFEGHLGEGHVENRYDLVPVEVLCGGAPLTAHAYIARPDPSRRDPGLTSARYMQHLIDGAVAHGLPADYLAMLRAIPTFD